MLTFRTPRTKVTRAAALGACPFPCRPPPTRGHRVPEGAGLGAWLGPAGFALWPEPPGALWEQAQVMLPFGYGSLLGWEGKEGREELVWTHPAWAAAVSRVTWPWPLPCWFSQPRPLGAVRGQPAEAAPAPHLSVGCNAVPCLAPG